MFANTIIDLLEDKEKYKHYKKMSSKRILNFSKENIMEQWIRLIED